MAIRLKVLGTGKLGSAAAAIYTVPTGKAAVVKNMRFVNPSGANATLNVFAKRTAETARRVLAKDTLMISNQMVSHSSEITLEYNDAIEGTANPSDTVEYVLSGIERDV